MLAGKFENFEAEPDLNAGEKLFHSLHPADLALYDLLSHNESTAPHSALEVILNELKHSSHPIDIALHKHLKDLDAKPLRPLTIPPEPAKTSKQYKWWLILPLLLSIISAIYFLYPFNSPKMQDSGNSGSSDINQPGLLNNKKTLEAKRDEAGGESMHSHSNNAHSNSVKSGKGHFNRNYNYKPDERMVSKKNQSQKGRKDNLFITDSESKSNQKSSLNDAANVEEESISEKTYLSVSKPGKLNFSYEFESPKLAEYRTIKYPQKGRISPLGIGLGIGFLNENGFSSKAGTDNLHKDFLNNYENSSNTPRNGIQISLLADYSAFRRIKFRTGAIYSYSSTNKKFDYVFDNIPVYNPDGSIKGYLTRPQQSSPQVHQNINTSSRSLNIPLHTLFMLHGSKKFSVWTGAGIQMNLSHFKNSKVFSFSKEELIDLDKTGISKFQGNVSIQVHYKINASWSLQFTAENTYRKEYAETEGIMLNGKSIVPAFNIGLMFNPILKNK